MVLKYLVAYPFRAFKRDYKKGQILTADDLSCWLPEADRDAELAHLLMRGILVAPEEEAAPEPAPEPHEGADQ